MFCFLNSGELGQAYSPDYFVKTIKQHADYEKNARVAII